MIKNAVRKNLEAIKLKSSDENDINQTIIEADAEEENAQSEEPDKNENSPVNVKDKCAKVYFYLILMLIFSFQKRRI